MNFSPIFPAKLPLSSHFPPSMAAATRYCLKASDDCNIRPLLQLLSCPPPFQFYKKALPSLKIYCAYVKGDALAGVAVLGELKGEPYLYYVVVEPALRGRGVGGGLLAFAAKDVLSESEKMALKAHAKEEEVGWYEKLGWKKGAFFERYYGRGGGGWEGQWTPKVEEEVAVENSSKKRKAELESTPSMNNEAESELTPSMKNQKLSEPVSVATVSPK